MFNQEGGEIKTGMHVWPEPVQGDRQVCADRPWASPGDLTETEITCMYVGHMLKHSMARRPAAGSATGTDPCGTAHLLPALPTFCPCPLHPNPPLPPGSSEAKEGCVETPRRGGAGGGPALEEGAQRLQSGSSPVDEGLVLAAVVLNLEHPHGVCWPPWPPAHQP